jgi:hypothetical protein
MNKRLWAVGGIFLATGLSVSAFALEGKHGESDEKPTIVVGELIDTACFTTSDGEAKGVDHADCAKECLASGIPAGILPEGKSNDHLLFLLTNPKPFAEYAAKTIKIEGVVHGKKAIDVKKAYAKDGEIWKEIKLDDAHHKMMSTDEQKKEDGHGSHKH